jgi:hypothetical protein
LKYSAATWLVSVDPGPIPANVAAFGLGDGETAVLTHALANPGSGAIIDDQAARNAAVALGIPHQGMLRESSSRRCRDSFRPRARSGYLSPTRQRGILAGASGSGAADSRTVIKHWPQVGE